MEQKKTEKIELKENTTEQPEKEAPKKKGRPKTEKKKDGIFFGLDNDSAVVVRCQYNKRPEMAQRLFTVHRNAEGLLLRVPACGSSVCYQSADRIPQGWNICGCGKHQFVKWEELD